MDHYPSSKPEKAPSYLHQSQLPKEGEMGRESLPLPCQTAALERRSGWEIRVLNWVLLPAAILMLLLHLSSDTSFSLVISIPTPSCISSCRNLPPLEPSSYFSRQSVLSTTLRAVNASAYIAEPSSNTLYYFNVSSRQWHLSERPFLLALLPSIGEAAEAETFAIVPSFEETRARTQLRIVGRGGQKGEITFLPWEESQDPYAKLRQLLDARGEGKVIVDEGMRTGIMGELANALGGKRSVIVSPKAVREIRERKNLEELALLRCANELTLHAIKATKNQIRIGMTESQVAQLLDIEASKVGVEDKIGSDGLILFGDDAALPHGSSTVRTLGEEDLILIDVGGSFRGYVADITRTFALSESKISQKHLDIWYLVRRAQSAAYASVRLGVKASEVDEAARSVIHREGLGERFTHRLGHGIGLQGHEAPYLHAGNKEVTLLPGNSFSNEPGIYIEGEVGVRLEDCWYMSEDGSPIAFTPQATSPWEL